MVKSHRKSIGIKIDGTIFKKEDNSILYLSELRELLEKVGLKIEGDVQWVDEDGVDLIVSFY